MIASLAAALRATLIPPRLDTDLSVDEVANYVADRFLREPELWRIHVRTIHGLLRLIELTTHHGDGAERALRKAEYFFLVGLFAVGVAFAILIAMVTL
ncbi:MAG: hypothetical protein JST08_18610 [Actinobacteria bacterium]|nr:hypothetical protein [Actinomycetota bacterium]